MPTFIYEIDPGSPFILQDVCDALSIVVVAVVVAVVFKDGFVVVVDVVVVVAVKSVGEEQTKMEDKT